MKKASLASGAPARKRRRPITGEELHAMGDIGPCELVRGKIVLAKPAGFRHGSCAGNFYHELRSFVEPRRLGTVAVGEVGVFTERHPDTVRGADVVFISNERRDQEAPQPGYLTTAPDLVVEIISRSDSRAKISRKVGEYFACGVRLVWVADPVRRTVRAYRSPEDVRTFSQGDSLPGDDVIPGLSVPVARLFDAGLDSGR